MVNDAYLQPIYNTSMLWLTLYTELGSSNVTIAGQFQSNARRQISATVWGNGIWVVMKASLRLKLYQNRTSENRISFFIRWPAEEGRYTTGNIWAYDAVAGPGCVEDDHQSFPRRRRLKTSSHSTEQALNNSLNKNRVLPRIFYKCGKKNGWWLLPTRRSLITKTDSNQRKRVSFASGGQEIKLSGTDHHGQNPEYRTHWLSYWLK